LGERIAAAQERIATIDRELARLEQWDGQATYDAAMRELSAINAAFAAAEEQASAERGEATIAAGATAVAADAATPEAASLADVLVALAQADGAGDGWGGWPTVIPTAPASLGWMVAEVERLTVQPLPVLEPAAVAEPDREAVPLLAGEAGQFRVARNAGIQFGEAIAQHRVLKPEVTRPNHREAEVRQLPLF